MKIAFHTHGLTLRGSEVALWDYARGARDMLGAEVSLAFPWQPELERNPVYALWSREFPCLAHRGRHDLGRRLRERGVEVLYQIKPGRDDGLVVPGVRNCIHAMFPAAEFHGEVYAYVSAWLSREMTGRRDRFVPHLVPRLVSSENLRVRLGIPAGARVFGRHGAVDTFNIPWVHRAVLRHARQHPGDHFVFLNTEPFSGAPPANLHFLPATPDREEKARFLATCDAMLHARWHGETFGLAVGEFAALGKPVITFAGSRERAHLEMLGSRAVVYHTRTELEEVLASFRPHPAPGTEYEKYADRAVVMKMFQEVFLS